MAIKFKETTKHSGQTFLPEMAVAFDDARAEEYFLAAGQASKTSETPVHMFPVGTLEIDEGAVFADGPNKGEKILKGAKSDG